MDRGIRSVCRGKGVKLVASKIAKETHKFWEALAILAGVFLVFHGAVSLIFLDQPFVFRFFSWAESFIGLTTIIIDGWFLTHI